MAFLSFLHFNVNAFLQPMTSIQASPPSLFLLPPLLLSLSFFPFSPSLFIQQVTLGFLCLLFHIFPSIFYSISLFIFFFYIQGSSWAICIPFNSMLFYVCLVRCLSVYAHAYLSVYLIFPIFLPTLLISVPYLCPQFMAVSLYFAISLFLFLFLSISLLSPSLPLSSPLLFFSSLTPFYSSSPLCSLHPMLLHLYPAQGTPP